VVGVLLALALVLVFAFSLSWIFTVLGLIMRTPSAVMSVGTVVLFPHYLTGNLPLSASSISVPPTLHWSVLQVATSLISSGAVEAHGVR